MNKASKNTYLLMRHGQSEANVAGVIASNPKTELTRYGLSQHGKSQAKESAVRAKEAGLIGPDALVISSDFLRAKETAEIAHEVIGAIKPLVIDQRLHERWFGTLDTGQNHLYQSVWEADQRDHTHTESEVEAVSAVTERVSALVEDLERQHQDRTILLVSHGDTLQILQSWANGTDPRRHTGLALETAEIRPLLAE